MFPDSTFSAHHMSVCSVCMIPKIIIKCSFVSLECNSGISYFYLFPFVLKVLLTGHENEHHVLYNLNIKYIYIRYHKSYENKLLYSFAYMEQCQPVSLRIERMWQGREPGLSAFWVERMFRKCIISFIDTIFRQVEMTNVLIIKAV